MGESNKPEDDQLFTTNITNQNEMTSIGSLTDNCNNLNLDDEIKSTINKTISPPLNDISPSTLEALKTLSTISSYSGVETITDCDKLRASLEQIRAKKNMKLFNKLDKIRQDFSGLNFKLAQMEESISDLKKGTSNFVKSLPPDSN